MAFSSLTAAQRRRLAVLVLALVAAIVVWRHFAAHTGAPAASVPAPIVPRATTGGQPASARRLVVDVVGAVHAPGLYRLPAASRVADAVRAAGGLTRRADPLLVNLAAPVADGEQVVVAARGSPAGAASGGAASGAPGSPAPVDLNSATAEELDALPGIGPVTAQKIVDYRRQHGPFTSVADLDAIAGIGPARITNLQGLVVP
jgi:competence protein ComEA